MSIAALTNVVAMLLSLVAIVQLGLLVPKIGGVFGTMLKLIGAGIFFAVFIHAFVELLAVFNLVGEDLLLVIMGVLITIGSACFVAAAVVARKSVV